MKRTQENIDKAKQTRAQTRERRKTQTCVVRQLKLSRNKLNHTTKTTLDRMFLEAKWLYNAVVASGDPFNFDTKVKKVMVRMKDQSYEERLLTAI